MTRPALGCKGIPLRFCRAPAYINILTGWYQQRECRLILPEHMGFGARHFGGKNAHTLQIGVRRGGGGMYGIIAYVGNGGWDVQELEAFAIA